MLVEGGGTSYVGIVLQLGLGNNQFFIAITANPITFYLSCISNMSRHVPLE